MITRSSAPGSGRYSRLPTTSWWWARQRPREALARIPPTRPDVAILDVRLPDGSGIEVCREIRSNSPEIACVMLTSYADDEALFAAIMAGAAGYVLKQVGADNLVDDIRRVAGGQSLLDPALTERVLERLRRDRRRIRGWPASPPRNGGSSISWPRGRPTARSPPTLFLAEKTVKNYVSNLWPSWAWSVGPRPPATPRVSRSGQPRRVVPTPPGPEGLRPPWSRAAA